MTAVTFPYPAYTYRWTSGYGNRVNPITGQGVGFHGGVAQLAQERAEAAAAAAVPDPPTDVERLAAVLVAKVDTLTEADAAKALGVDEVRITAATAELAAEVTIEAAPIKGVTR